MKGEIVVSESTRVRVEEVKKYIQKKYNLNRIREEQRVQNWRLFEEKVRQLNLTLEEKQQAKQNILQQEINQLRRKRQKITKKNFQSICVIGKGAFGQVRLCRESKTGRVVAIKCLKKKEMIKKNQQVHLKAERNILADGGEWMVSLLYSFQDQNYLYLVMDYLPGGDLMNLLIARNVLEEHEAKFYAAEIVLAIDSIHRKNYIHRDLKPDNVLIDAKGHIQLSDFGLCKSTETVQDKLTTEVTNDYMAGQSPNMNLQNFKRCLHRSNGQTKRELAYSAVGTPDYIAPEMLRRVGYTELVDWWALGVIIYEMLIGYAPFTCENNEQIYYKIQHHQQYLYFPPQVHISFEVIDLISRLLTDPANRLGVNGVSEIKLHSWFSDINWNEIKNTTAPFVPDLESEIDTKYFDNYEQSEPWLYEGSQDSLKKDFNFVGYTYKLQLEGSKNIVKEELDKVQKQKNLEKEKQKLNMKKKNKVAPTQDISYAKNLFHKLHSGEHNLKTEVSVDKNKARKSKSPLAIKDTNKIKTKQSTSKSPLKIQLKSERLSGLPRKVAPLNLQSLGLTSMVYASAELNHTLTTRRSVKKCK